MAAFWEVVGALANLIEVFTFILVVILFLQARHALRRYLKARAEQVSEHPWALAIGIGGDISGEVKVFLAGQNLADMPLENYVQPGYLSPDHFYQVLRDMLLIKNRLSQAGATEVNLFYRGPVTLAMGIGSVFDNWVPIKVYEHSQGTYRLDFVLEKGSVLGLIGSGASSTLEEMLS